MKLLFVCSMNQWRSPAAEDLFQGYLGCETRSGGTESGARIKVTAGHIGWADAIFAMEKKHVRRLEEFFPEELIGKCLVCLNIPDNYHRDDPALAELLKASVIPHLVAPE